MVLIGTAGHVDHGKSTLVEALTGINPMHLPEEHRRELTIELGFAHLQHPDGYTIGIVDVPGHEKLVKTMISGASGFQIALWVVDAREGLMPQSLEHLDVLKLLRCPEDHSGRHKGRARHGSGDSRHRGRDPAIGRGPVADRRFHQQVRHRFSCRRRSLQRAAPSISDRSRIAAPPYMPIDRCFVLKGVGTVVTGTLVRGELKEGRFRVAFVTSGTANTGFDRLHNHNADREPASPPAIASAFTFTGSRQRTRSAVMFWLRRDILGDRDISTFSSTAPGSGIPMEAGLARAFPGRVIRDGVPTVGPRSNRRGQRGFRFIFRGKPASIPANASSCVRRIR